MIAAEAVERDLTLPRAVAELLKHVFLGSSRATIPDVLGEPQFIVIAAFDAKATVILVGAHQTLSMTVCGRSGLFSISIQ